MTERADGKPRNRKAASAKAKALVLERDVLRLRLAGLTLREIAEALGVSLGGVHKALTRALEKTAKERAQYGAQELDLQISRLERILAAAWDRAINGDLEAIDRVLRCIEKLILYQGLEPQRKVQVGFQVEPENLKDWIDMLKGAVLDQSPQKAPQKEAAE